MIRTITLSQDVYFDGFTYPAGVYVVGNKFGEKLLGTGHGEEGSLPSGSLTFGASTITLTGLRRDGLGMAVLFVKRNNPGVDAGTQLGFEDPMFSIYLAMVNNITTETVASLVAFINDPDG